MCPWHFMKVFEQGVRHGNKSNIIENLFRCYSMMTQNNFIEQEEMHLVDAWIGDISDAPAARIL